MSNIITLNFSSDQKKLMVGLSWDPNEKSTGVLGGLTPHNLDLSCAVFNADLEVCDIITPLEPKREQYKGKIFHRGDSTSGGGDFEDEDVTVYLDSLQETDRDIRAMAFIVSINDRVQFSEVKNASCAFMDGINLEPFLSIDLKGLEANSNNASSQQHFVVGYVTQGEDGSWTLKNIQKPIESLGQSAIEAAVKA